MTGIDLDAKALAYRREVVGDLDEAIVGDLREVDLKEGSYDVVFSAFVLEHIEGAESVLDGMVDALRPGGLLVLRVPDGDAVYAYLARLLPHWTHVLYKRIAQRDPMAGKPGHPPYRVVYDDLISRAAFRDYITRRGLVLVDEVGTNPHIDNLGRLGPIGMFVQKLIARLSFGRLAGTHSNLTLVITKP
jgi:SAM-dependent methyltransferase